MFKKRNPALAKLYEGMNNMNPSVANQNLQKFAQALELPVRKGIFDCDNLFNIFEPMDFRDSRCVEFPLDPVKPGTEGDYTAYAIPDCACLPCAMMQGDYVIVPTYMVGNCVEWCLKRARHNNFIRERSVDAFRAGFTKKLNDDGWHVILGAGLDRNMVVYDSAAQPGQLTKRLVALMKTIMRRNGGGNSTCNNRARMTDLFMSPEAMDDIYNWNTDQVSDQIRTEIFKSNNCDMGLMNIFCVNLHVLDELGQNQEYQLYYENELGGAMPSDKIELVVGLDLSTRDSFVMPVAQELQMFPDDTQRKCMREGVYGWMELGMSVLNSQRVLLGSL